MFIRNILLIQLKVREQIKFNAKKILLLNDCIKLNLKGVELVIGAMSLITQLHKKKVLIPKLNLPAGKFFDDLKTNLKSEFSLNPQILPQLPQPTSKQTKRANILLCVKVMNKSILVTFFDVLKANLNSEFTHQPYFLPQLSQSPSKTPQR